MQERGNGGVAFPVAGAQALRRDLISSCFPNNFSLWLANSKAETINWTSVGKDSSPQEDQEAESMQKGRKNMPLEVTPPVTHFQPNLPPLAHTLLNSQWKNPGIRTMSQ